jgi:hypothetical protein
MMDEQDAKVWKEATARIAELDKSIRPAITAAYDSIEPEMSQCQALIAEIEERAGGEIVPCELCGEPFYGEESSTFYDDVGPCCPACGESAREAMEKCDHRFVDVETDDGPGLDCERCCCRVLAEDAERFLGTDRYAMFQAGGLRAET